jgi:hypothetical protein
MKMARKRQTPSVIDKENNFHVYYGFKQIEATYILKISGRGSGWAGLLLFKKKVEGS